MRILLCPRFLIKKCSSMLGGGGYYLNASIERQVTSNIPCRLVTIMLNAPTPVVLFRYRRWSSVSIYWLANGLPDCLVVRCCRVGRVLIKIVCGGARWGQDGFQGVGKGENGNIASMHPILFFSLFYPSRIFFIYIFRNIIE